MNTTQRTDDQREQPVELGDVDLSQKKLDDLYKNVTMAKSAIEDLLPEIESQSFRSELQEQIDAYGHFEEEIEQLADNLGFKLKPINFVAKSMASASMKMQMAADNSEENAARIMFLGSTNGIVDLCKALRHDTDVHPDITKLSKTILKYEEDKTELMKYRM